MAGRPPPLAPLGQGPFAGLVRKNANENENEEVWEVDLNVFGKPPVGNVKELGNSVAAMRLFNKPETPRVLPKIITPPGAPERKRKWNVPAENLKLETPKKQMIRPRVPKTPRRPTGVNKRKASRTRKLRKSRRQNRLRK